MFLNRKKACEILNIDENDSENIEVVKKAFKKRALHCHPDKIYKNPSVSNDEFVKIKIAYDFLIKNDKKTNDHYNFTLNEIYISLIFKFLNIFKSVINSVNVNYDTFDNSDGDDDEFFDAEEFVYDESHVVKESYYKKKYDINIKLSLPLDEIYTDIGKKIVVKCKSKDNTLINRTLYLSLDDYTKHFMFKGMGDWNPKYNEYGDLYITIHAKEHKEYFINSFLDKHELVKFISIDLYEYFYGIDREITHFGEVIKINHIPFKKGDNLIIKGKGLRKLYNDSTLDDAVKRGDLYIFFKVDLTIANIDYSNNLSKDLLKNIFHNK